MENYLLTKLDLTKIGANLLKHIKLNWTKTK